VIDSLNAIVELSPRRGFWKCFDRLRLDGRRWNHKRVWRVHCQSRLNIPKRTKKRAPECEPVPMQAGTLVNQGWALDFMHDVLYDGAGCRRRSGGLIARCTVRQTRHTLAHD
jgi:putative transposase